jgi:hypothetical protein
MCYAMCVYSNAVYVYVWGAGCQPATRLLSGLGVVLEDMWPRSMTVYMWGRIHTVSHDS